MATLATIWPTFDPAPNPFSLLARMSLRQWMFFLVAFLAWTWDSFDYFTVSLTLSDLGEEFGKTTEQMSWGLTVALMFRSVGAIAFGMAADRYGRKWPFIINNILFIFFELGTGFTQTYVQFLAVRSLYGIAMGGLYGNAAATALEDAPEEARGLLSGILQQGYALGYLLATVFARAFVGTSSYGWRPLFWCGACPPLFTILLRLALPETETYQERAAERGEIGSAGKVFITEAKVALKRHWALLVYLFLLMTGFNFMVTWPFQLHNFVRLSADATDVANQSHGSQDLYPTMLQTQYSFSTNRITITQVVANLGAILGGLITGYSSQIFGRRFCIAVALVLGGAVVYPYTFVHNDWILAAAFFEQFCVQGAWGVVPIHLMELSPAPFRTFVVGTAFQLGNLASSASPTIEAKVGLNFPLPPTVVDGEITSRYEYGKVMFIFMGCVFAYLLFLTAIGPENRKRGMLIHDDDDMAAVKIQYHVSFEVEEIVDKRWEERQNNTIYGVNWM